jgi:hypothetical protein
VPFDAVKGFFDPSVQFGLQFEEVGEDAPRTAAANAPDKQPAKAPENQAETKKRPPAAEQPEAEPAPASIPEPPDEPPAGGAEVVRLDRFRKK